MKQVHTNHKQNRITYRLILTLVVTLVAAWSFLAAESQVSISASATLATIGDRINLKVIVKTSDDIDQINIIPTGQASANGNAATPGSATGAGTGTGTSTGPGTGAGTGAGTGLDFEIISAAAEPIVRHEKDYTVFEKNLTIAFFKTGDFDIVPFTVQLLKNGKVIETKETNSIPVTVQSVLLEEDKDIKPLKDPLALKGNPLYILKYVILVLGIVLAVILVVYLVKRRAGKTTAVQPLLPPLEELDAALKKLWSQDLFDKGKIKQFFIQLTQIIKHFLERQYDFNASDCTTYETFFFLKQKENDTTILDNLDFILRTADLVKFAKYIPAAGVPSEIKSKIDDMTGIYKKRESIIAQQPGPSTETKANRQQTGPAGSPQPNPQSKQQDTDQDKTVERYLGKSKQDNENKHEQ